MNNRPEWDLIIVYSLTCICAIITFAYVIRVMIELANYVKIH
jgi:hypothetical protein